jgi:hypothetical protein
MRQRVIPEHQPGEAKINYLTLSVISEKHAIYWIVAKVVPGAERLPGFCVLGPARIGI